MRSLYWYTLTGILLVIPHITFAEIILTVTPYRTTVHLEWEDTRSAEAMGYYMYRSASDIMPATPVRTIGAYAQYTDYKLQPLSTYYYWIVSFDQQGNPMDTSSVWQTRTDDKPYLKVASLDVFIPIYTDRMHAGAPDEIREGLEFARQFYFRNTYGRLNLNYHFWEINEAPPPAANRPADFNSIGQDLRNRGIQNNQYDAIHVAAIDIYGWYGGAIWLGETAGSMAYNWTGFRSDNHFTRGDAWVFTHELGHSLDRIAERSGFPEMIFNHYSWAYPLPPGIPVFDAGENFDGMALVLRLFQNHLNYRAPYDGYIEVVDADGDALADADMRLPLDEVRWGSDPTRSDADMDGWNDLEEMTADNYRGSDPYLADTDMDGIKDADDPFPLIDFSDEIQHTTQAINIDGQLSEASWQHLSSGHYFSLMGDPAWQSKACWDDQYLYFAFQADQPLKYYLMMDASGENGIFTSNARWTGGNYQSINELAWGDAYFEKYSLLIRSDENRVYMNGQPVNQSEVVTHYEQGTYTTEFKIPHNLGHGFGYNYVPLSAPEIDRLQFTEGHIIGLQLVAQPLATARSWEWADWRTENWITVGPTFHYQDVQLVAEQPSQEYCQTESGFPWHEWIAEVQVGSTSHSSGKSTYSDFTATVIDLKIGEELPVLLTSGFSYETWDEHWSIWIDFNQDLHFDPVHERVFEGWLSAPAPGTPEATIQGIIQLPDLAKEGLTRMRVSMRRGQAAATCGAMDFGETEDYQVRILPAGDQPVEPLCVSKSTAPWQEWIAGVSMAGMDNPSGKSAYSDFSDRPVSVEKGHTYFMKLTTGFSYATWNEHWRIYADFNQDGHFDPATEIIYSAIHQAPPAGTTTASAWAGFRIPEDARTGVVRLRISMSRTEYAPACGEFAYGETEDYALLIQNPPIGFRQFRSGLQDDKWLLAPNPVSEQIRLFAPSDEDGKTDWSIYDNNGRLRQSGQSEGSRSAGHPITVDQLPDGLYTIQLLNKTVRPVVIPFAKISTE